MTFPAGNLPVSGDLGDKFVPVATVAFTSGGSDLDLTRVACQPCALELYCTSSGNIVGCLPGDIGPAPTYTATPQTYPVAAGQVLQGAFVLLKSTSTANCIARR